MFLFSLCTGGRSGICWPNFQSAHNSAPAKAHHVNMNYNSIKGLMTVKGWFSLWDLESNWLFEMMLGSFFPVNMLLTPDCTGFLCRHNICQLQKCLLFWGKRHVHHKPTEWRPAAPCADFRHSDDQQHRRGQSVYPQTWFGVGHSMLTDVRSAKALIRNLFISET